MPKRLPIAYDPPAKAQPEETKYTKAMFRRAKTVQFIRRVRHKETALLVLALIYCGFVTYDQRKMAHEMVELAKFRPVHLVEPTEGGHYRVTLVNNVIEPTKGARLQAAEWFTIWMRRVSKDVTATSQDQAAGRARTANGADKKWDALLKNDIKPQSGQTRDVLNVRSEEVSYDAKTGLSTIAVVWREKVWKANGKPMVDLVGESVKRMAIVTRDGPPREGAWDGVNVVDFSEPMVMPDVNTHEQVSQVPGQ